MCNYRTVKYLPPSHISPPSSSCLLYYGRLPENKSQKTCCGVLDLSDPLIFCVSLPQDSFILAPCLAVGLSICFHLLMNETSQGSVMLGSHLQAEQSFINNLRDWFSYRVCLKLGWSLVGPHLNLCSLFIPVHLVRRTNFRS